MNRRDLRFGLGYMPRFVIVLVGMIVGFANGIDEVIELWKIDQHPRN